MPPFRVHQEFAAVGRDCGAEMVGDGLMHAELGDNAERGREIDAKLLDVWLADDRDGEVAGAGLSHDELRDRTTELADDAGGGNLADHVPEGLSEPKIAARSQGD